MAKNKLFDEDFIQNFSEYLIDKMKDIFVTKEDIKHLPTKEEFYSQTDKVMKELKDLREEVTVSTYQTKRNSEEIEKLKTAVLN